MSVTTEDIERDLFVLEQRIAEWRAQSWTPEMALLLIELSRDMLRAEEQIARWRAGVVKEP